MKRLFLALCLLCSFSAFADATQDWNKRFSDLNNVPINIKWAASGQQNYFKRLMATRPDYFKNPDDYRLPIAPIPAVPYVPPVVVQGDIVKDLLKRIKADVESLDKQFQ